MRLAPFILDHLEEILEDWAAFARSLPPGRTMSVEGLRDHAEAMLRAIAEDMDTAQTEQQQFDKSRGLAAAPLEETGAEQHASGRLVSGFDIKELVAEYRALRATVVRHWTAHAGPLSSPALDELVRFNEGIDQALAESVSRFAEDVDRSRRAELARRASEAEARRRNEERLQTALEAADLGTWEFDPLTDTTPERSLRHDEMYGHAELQPEWGVRIAERQVLPDDLPAFRAALDRARETGVLATEYRVRWPDGSVHWLAVRGRTFYDGAGQPVRMTGVVADVTERRTAEAAVRESEERFRLMADGLPLMVWVHDAHGRQELVNATFCEFFGVTRHEMRDHRWRLLLHPDDEAAYVAAFEAASLAQQPFHAEARVRRHDGEWRWIESWGRPRVSSAGRFFGYVGASTDATDRRRVAEALREADRQKDRFIALLAHELRNPLAPIRNASAILLRQETADATLRWCGEVIERQVGQMSHLLDDLLDVSRITFGKLHVTLERCDVARVIEQAVETAWPVLKARRDRLVTALAAGPLFVRADRMRLAQVLTNLLTNAAKYSPADTEVRISAERDGDEVVLAVTDRGVGIEPAHLQSVFEMFAQVGAADAAGREGLGIGLGLAKALVELQHGRISAKSEGTGRGSRFEVRLPALASDAPAAATVAGTRPAARPLRVLVVDDVRDSADSLALVLRQGGHDVRVAYDGDAALACAAEYRPEAAFIDLGMPGMDGLDLARKLRASEYGRGALLVAVTGWGADEDRSRTREEGFDAHLTKPVAVDALHRMLSGATA